MPVRRALIGACTTLALVLAPLLGVTPARADPTSSASPSATASTASYHDGPCVGNEGVSVVVDYGDAAADITNGSTPVVRCALGAQASGLAALQAADFTLGMVPGQGAICTINSVPKAGYPTCWYDGYWAYSLGEPGGSWDYSSVGAAGRVPPLGSVDGWRYTLLTTSNSFPSVGPSFLPSISAQPVSVAVTAGHDARFSVTATATPSPTYQWQKLTADGSWADIDGATSATLALPSVTIAQDSSQYRAQITNAAGTVDSNWAKLTVLAFADVSQDNKFFTEIQWLANQGVTTGWLQDDQTRFYLPLSPIHRDAMAAYLYRLAGSPTVTLPTTSPFTDVSTTDQYYKEIVWLSQQKITTGFPDRTYRPLDNVNRDAMAAFLYRYAKSPTFNTPTTSPFTDLNPGDQFYKEITWLDAQKITTGWPDNTYRPLTPVARDAMAAFLYRLKNND